MQKTLLLQVLQSLDKGELKRWSLIIQADYHLQNRKTRALGQHIYQYAPDWGHAHLQKEQAWALVYQEAPYREMVLNNHLSDLLQLTYRFLALEELAKRPAQETDLLLTQLMNKGLTLQSKRTLKKWQLVAQQEQQLGPDHLYAKSRLAYFEDIHGLMGSQRKYSIALQQKSDYLDQYYVLQQLMYYCEMLNRGNIIQGTYQMPYLADLLERYTRNDQQLQDIPSISIYVNVIRMLLGVSPEEHLATLEQMLRIHASVLSEEEWRTVYDYLFNYCIQQINLGKTNYYPKIFQLYRSMVAQDLLLRENRLSQWTYTNIITTGSRLKEWAWTEFFLTTYRKFLPPEDQFNTYHYNLAALRYEQRDYTSALAGLQQVEFTDAFYQLAAKTIQLKIYYQLEEKEAFDALMLASRQFISRNQQLSPSKKAAYMNFLKLSRSLFTLRHEQPYWSPKKWQQRAAALQEKILLPEFTANNKDWLGGELQLLQNRSYPK